MKIVIVSVGKQKGDLGEDLVKDYELRLLRYLPVEWIYVPHSSVKEEGDKILSLLKKEDYVVLLDERGKELTNTGLAELVENRMLDAAKRMVFVVGGSYGVVPEVQKRANYMWKLGSLIFPHRIVRIILLEQLYRTMTILQGAQYHHE